MVLTIFVIKIFNFFSIFAEMEQKTPPLYTKQPIPRSSSKKEPGIGVANII